MEINHEAPAWLNPAHPNYFRWKSSRELSIERGKFVKSIISQSLEVKGLTILDLGSGEGGTSKVFSQDNFVVSFDLSLLRLQRQQKIIIPNKEISNTEESVLYIPKEFSFDYSLEKTLTHLINGNALQLPFSNNSFDLIIIQDVIEHLAAIYNFSSEVKRVLKPNGNIYLSTPNKLSIFNFISDPHFGLPIISILNRKTIKNYFLKYFRKDDYYRKDIAQLLSLADLLKLFNIDFEIKINTKFALKELFNGNKGIVWSVFHLKLIAFCNAVKLDKLLIKIANDKIGIINKYFTPTFYLMLKLKGKINS